jgi:hypothetical protein
MALSEIALQQAAPTENTIKRVNQFLDYMWTHPDVIIWCRASDMILNVQSDASLTAVLVVTSSLAVSHKMETQLN